MPAARQRSRSPFMAWAVMAMIGIWNPVAPSRGADRRDGLKPSISGMDTSMRTKSNFSLSSASRALRPLLTTTTLCPCFSRRRDAST